MKAPEEIKKGLEYLSTKDIVKKLDMWKEGIEYDYAEDAASDALALIKQLQAENAEKDARSQQLEAELKDEKNNHQHTVEIAERQKEQIKKLKNVIVRLNNERAHRDDQCGHAGPGIRDNY